MNGSNIDPRNSIHRSPLRETYLLIAGVARRLWAFHRSSPLWGFLRSASD